MQFIIEQFYFILLRIDRKNDRHWHRNWKTIRLCTYYPIHNNDVYIYSMCCVLCTHSDQLAGGHHPSVSCLFSRYKPSECIYTVQKQTNCEDEKWPHNIIGRGLGMPSGCPSTSLVSLSIKLFSFRFHNRQLQYRPTHNYYILYIAIK